MVTAANICKEMVGACMAVHLAGQPVIFTARDEPAGTVTIAALLIAGQGKMRMASCLTRIMIAVGNILRGVPYVEWREKWHRIDPDSMRPKI